MQLSNPNIRTVTNIHLVDVGASFDLQGFARREWSCHNTVCGEIFWIEPSLVVVSCNLHLDAVNGSKGVFGTNEYR